MKQLLLVLAVVAGALSLVTTLGILRTSWNGQLSLALAWLLAFVLAALALYALRSALRSRGDELSISSEERRLQIEMRSLLAQRRRQTTDERES